jgi:hypothetical protein
MKTGERGFTVMELLLAAGLGLVLLASLLELLHPAQLGFLARLEETDISQRLRVAIETVSQDLRMAAAGLPYGESGVAPYPSESDDQGITVRYLLAGSHTVVSRSYYLRTDLSAGRSGLRRLEGETDVPVVDHVEDVRFEYFDAAGIGIAPARASVAARRVRMTVTIRPVSATLRVGPRSILSMAAQPAVADVSPRNLEGME